MSKTKFSGFLNEVVQWTEAIVFAAVVALLVRGFLFEPVIVEGGSMENTLYNEERLLVYKLGYYFSEPKAGDIVVLKYQEGVAEFLPFLKYIPLLNKAFPDVNEIDYIKRVIALPGDEVDIKGGKVYVNGTAIDEPYAKGETYRNGGDFPLKVPENKVFVLGDNRENSRDSRQIGFIDIKRIKGKAVFRIWPLKKFGRIY